MKYSLLSVTLSVISSAQAAPYQFQVSGAYANSESDIDTFFGQNITTESDDKIIGLTYYLRPVDATSGPLSERAFLSKSAWLSGNYSVSEIDEEDAEEVTTATVNTRFVTQTDMIFEVDYIKIDAFFDETTYSFGAGKYLDRNTTAVLKFSRSDDELSILSVNYRKLVSDAAADTNMAFTGSIGFIDTEFDSGFQLNINGRYYFSDQFSADAGMLLQSIGDSNSTTLTVNGEYFLTDSIFGGIGFTQASLGDFIDTSTFALTVGARF